MKIIFYKFVGNDFPCILYIGDFEIKNKNYEEYKNFYFYDQEPIGFFDIVDIQNIKNYFEIIKIKNKKEIIEYIKDNYPEEYLLLELNII